MIAFDRAGELLAKDLAETRTQIFRISFLPDLATITGGFRAGETSVIASFPKHGKTALAEQVALDLSVEYPVLFLPLEMGAAATRLRLAAKLARCEVSMIERAGLDAVTRGELNQRKLVVRAPKPNEKWGIARLHAGIKKIGAPIVIIDHLRWIDGWLEGGMKPTRIAEQIREIAHELQVHIIMCAQLKIEDFGKKPMLWRLQDSAAIQQLVSIEMLIHRPYFGMNRDNIAEVVVRSNRWGPSGRIHTRWVGPTQSMWHLTRDEFEQLGCTCVPREKRAATA